MRIAAAALALCLGGCNTASSEAPESARYGPHVISPAMAIMAAADEAPQGYPGRFGMTVMATGWAKGRLFLNSREDYRDPRNLSIAIDRHALPQLRKELGPDLESAFLTRTIEVDGVAKKEKIVFTIGGRASDKYYFQTHVRVSDPDQIRILD